MDNFESKLGRKLQNFFTYRADRINKTLVTREDKVAKGEYQCIFLSHDQFVDCLDVVKHYLGSRLTPYHFIDAGCGLGHKLLLAHCFGFGKVTGLEIQPEYIEEAKKLLKECYDYFDSLSHLISIVQADILTYNYSKADVIYFYVPLHDYEKEKIFENRVVKTARPDTIIIGANNQMLEKHKALERISSLSPVYRKKS